MIKKFTLIVTIFALFISSAFSVNALSNSIDFWQNDIKSDNNRLISVNVYAKYNGDLSAAYFEFAYNSDMFEYRNVKANDKSNTVKAYNKNSKINVVFLNADGYNIKKGEIILSVILKAKKSGTSYLDYTVDDCIDKNLNNIKVNSCKASKIVINGTNNNDNTNEKNKKSNNNIDKNSIEDSYKTNGKSEHIDNEHSSIDELGMINQDSQPYILAFLVGIVLMCIVGAVIIVTYKICKNKFKKEN